MSKFEEKGSTKNRLTPEVGREAARVMIYWANWPIRAPPGCLSSPEDIFPTYINFVWKTWIKFSAKFHLMRWQNRVKSIRLLILCPKLFERFDWPKHLGTRAGDLHQPFKPGTHNLAQCTIPDSESERKSQILRTYLVKNKTERLSQIR